MFQTIYDIIKTHGGEMEGKSRSPQTTDIIDSTYQHPSHHQTISTTCPDDPQSFEGISTSDHQPMSPSKKKFLFSPKTM